MTQGKQSGLGDQFYIGGVDLSGDVNALSSISGSMTPIDVTAINESANQRIGGLRIGDIQFTTFYEAATSHAALKVLPRADTIATYFRGAALLSECASVNALQIGYDPTRDASGNLTMMVDAQSDSYGLEWGVQLTPGLRTDTAATVGAFADDSGAAGNSFGAQAYIQLTAITGTSVTVSITHCATSGGSYTTLMSTTAMTAPGAQRITVSNTTAVNRYLKVVTAGTFTAATFAVHWTRNSAANQVF